jgi:hypothetical protein
MAMSPRTGKMTSKTPSCLLNHHSSICSTQISIAVKPRHYFLNLAVLALACFLAACETEPQGQYTSMLIDETDEYNVKSFIDRIQRDTGTLMDQFHLKSNYSLHFRLAPINELGQNQDRTYDINYDLQQVNEYYPPPDYTSSKNEFRKALKALIPAEPNSKSQSQIYLPVCRELERLVAAPSYADKLLILYSNMLENSSKVSMINGASYEGLLQELEQAYGEKLPASLEGIRIYIYSSRTLENDAESESALLFWQKAFTERGAVLISSLEEYSTASK